MLVQRPIRKSFRDVSSRHVFRGLTSESVLEVNSSVDRRPLCMAGQPLITRHQDYQKLPESKYLDGSLACGVTAGPRAPGIEAVTLVREYL